jgi:hypothetical protein
MAIHGTETGNANATRRGDLLLIVDLSTIGEYVK